MTLYDKRKANDAKHLHNPEVGDYWNECFTAICVVLSVTKNTVLVCKRTKRIEGTDDRTWDLETVHSMTRDDFIDWLSYGSGVKGTWCSVAPRQHIGAVEEFKAIRSPTILSRFDFEWTKKVVTGGEAAVWDTDVESAATQAQKQYNDCEIVML